MLKQLPKLIFVLLVLLLAACGKQAGTTVAASPSTVATISNSADTGPEDTVNKALEAMAQKDQATLIDLFDSSVATYAAPFAHGAIDDWSSLQNKVDPLSTMALGPIQSQEMKAPETSGQTTRLVVVVTYEIGKADWIFSLRQRDQMWNLLEVKRTTTERK